MAVDLIFKRSSATRIVRAEVTVHGNSGEVRLIPAAGESSADLTESFTVERGDGGSALPNRELWTKAMTTISWVEITEVTFDNGIVWHEPHAGTCRATPSLFVPVSGN
jgi:hypothetical protein